MVTIERPRQLEATFILPAIVQTEPVKESIDTVSPPEKSERFGDRRLGTLIGALIAVRRQHGYTDTRLIEEIARYSTSLDARSPKKTRRALAGIATELNETNYPSQSIDYFISAIKDQKPKIQI